MYSNMYTSILISQFIPLPPLSNLSVLKLFQTWNLKPGSRKKKTYLHKTLQQYFTFARILS